jgi:hypothetical protein
MEKVTQKNEGLLMRLNHITPTEKVQISLQAAQKS